MSRYLIRRIEENPAIVLRTRTQIVALEGNGRLERIRWRDDQTGQIESHDIGHVFMMTGARSQHRMAGRLHRAGREGLREDRAEISRLMTSRSAKWPLARPPYLLETDRPGIFAVGDVRGGNVKRVASAVGEDRLPSRLFIK